MTTRNGFVSNSSSSSFIAIVEKETYNAATKNVHPFLKDMFGFLSEFGIEAFGKQFVKIVIDTGESGEWIYDNAGSKKYKKNLTDYIKKTESDGSIEAISFAIDELTDIIDGIPKTDKISFDIDY